VKIRNERLRYGGEGKGNNVGEEEDSVVERGRGGRTREEETTWDGDGDGDDKLSRSHECWLSSQHKKRV